MKISKWLFLVWMMVLLASSSAESKDVLIYADDGTWLDGIIALEHFFDSEGIAHERLYAAELNKGTWDKSADVVVFPGGYSYDYQLAITLDAVDQLRQYVAAGGSYVGICAGAYFASKSVAWEGIEYTYELALFDGTAIGSLGNIAPWPEYAMTDISLNADNPILQVEQERLTVLYYGGPIFLANEGFEFKTIASWDAAAGSPAIINFNYEEGRVLLIGPHLEIEESDDRDGTDFAGELDDVESDWNALAEMFAWAVGDETSIAAYDDSENALSLSPNPAREMLTIELSAAPTSSYRLAIVNILGEVVKELCGNHHYLGRLAESVSKRFDIDISALAKGVYVLNFYSNSEIISRKFVKI